MKNTKEMEELINSLELEELEERIELGCLPLTGTGSGISLWTF